MLLMDWSLELLENLRNYAWLADWRDFVDILIVLSCLQAVSPYSQHHGCSKFLGIGLLLVVLGVSALLD